MSAPGGYSIFHDTMADMTFPEIVEASRAGAVVLWGLGVIEQHGPHLPLATDVYMPSALLRQVRRQLRAAGVESVIMPPFYWGVNHVSKAFPGTFEVRPQVMIEIMVDLITSLKKDAFSKLFCVSGHGDALHNRTILDALRRGAAETGMETYFVAAPRLFDRIGVPLPDPHALPTPGEPDAPSKFFDVHAGTFETSPMWAFYPDLVRKDLLPGLKPTEFVADDMAEWRKGGEHTLRKTPHGYLGDPAAADPAFGAQLIENNAMLVTRAIAAKLGVG